MIRRPPRSTLDRSSAASDVYKRQAHAALQNGLEGGKVVVVGGKAQVVDEQDELEGVGGQLVHQVGDLAVSYTHLRAHETVLDLVCRLLLDKK